MKKWIKKGQTFCKDYLEVFVCSLLLILILKQLALFDVIKKLIYSLVPVFGGVLLCFFLQPLIDCLQKKVSKKIAVMLVYGGILLLTLIIAIVLFPILYKQFTNLLEMLPTWLKKIELFFQKYHIQTSFLQEIKSYFTNDGYSMFFSSMQNVFTSLTRYAIAFFTAFFLSLDLDFWQKSVKKVYKNYEWISSFYKTMSNIIFQYIIGTLIDLVFVMISCGIILYLFQFENIILYAMILALSNLFPYIGPTIGLLIVVLSSSLLYEEVPYMMFVWIWVIQQIESNIIQPWIFTKALDVRPILTFVSLFISEALFGIIGVVLSPVFASIMQIAIRSYTHAKTKNTIGKWEDIWYDFDTIIEEMEVSNLN